MNIEKRVIDQSRGIIQITSTDERWYLIDDETAQGFTYYPSITWILNYYPKGVEFYKWLASKGWDESQAIKEAAGSRGNKVHNAVSDILGGYEIRIDSKFKNNKGVEEELSTEECIAIMSFVSWLSDMKEAGSKVETVAYDMTLFNKKIGYAGTLDWLLRIDGELWIVDFKTSQNMYPSFALQVSAYKGALCETFKDHGLTMEEVKNLKLGILQLGYNRNKNKYKFTEVDDKFELFRHTKAIWEEHHGGESPKQIELPEIIFKGKKKDNNTKI